MHVFKFLGFGLYKNISKRKRLWLIENLGHTSKRMVSFLLYVGLLTSAENLILAMQDI